MPVTFICPFCKKHYTAPDAMMGKVAACPGCGNEFQIPTQGARDLYEAAAFEMQQEAAAADFAPETPATAAATADSGRCPACGQKVPPGSRICVACGHNIFEPVPSSHSPHSDTAGSSPGYVRRTNKLPLLLAVVTILSAALAALFYLQGKYDATLIAATIAVPLGMSATAMLFREHRLFTGVLSALAMLGGALLLILSILGKHSQARADQLPRPTTYWHGGNHVPTAGTPTALC